FGSSLDQIGPATRNAKDMALAYQVTSGRDENDSTSVAFDKPDYMAQLETNKKFKIGIPKEYFGEGLDPEVEKIVQDAIKALEKAGHSFVEISLPLSDKGIAVYYIVACAEASSNLARYDGVKYGLREAGNADLMTMYNTTRAKGFGAEVKRRIMLGTYVLSSGYYEAYYRKASKVRELIRQDFEKAFQKVDLIISPTTPSPAFKIGEKVTDPLAMYLSDIYTVSANLACICAISVPFGQVKDGRPVGVQFAAPWFGELTLFQMANILGKLKN
ncbi:MAG TPA: amidase family protein, partial [candidate division Zixibacteria bacterium]|nr:amidase family protein [candidate division Zixibacteria bacterium]